MKFFPNFVDWFQTYEFDLWDATMSGYQASRPLRGSRSSVRSLTLVQNCEVLDVRWFPSLAAAGPESRC